ncbi:MAG: sugar ABC transporter permease [Actinomycetota bacterium]|nr:sugar ABC transporter permease [Actinomycetota bacterium]
MAAYAFTLPFVIVFLAMLVVPLLYSLYLSLFREQLVGGTTFIGLDNYFQAVVDPSFVAGVGRVALILVIQVPIMIGFALFFALLLDSGRIRGARAVRLIIFVPFAIPGVVATLIWGYIYGQAGPITQTFMGLGVSAPDLLSPNFILGSIINIVTWEFIGYNMVVMFSALRAIPTELYDAAAVDGAGQWRLAWSIKIPAIRPAILLTVIFSIIGTFQLFTEPSLLYKIAPTVVGTDLTPNLYAYNLAFVNQNTNYAAAISFLLGIVIAIVSYIMQLIVARRVDGENE